MVSDGFEGPIALLSTEVHRGCTAYLAMTILPTRETTRQRDPQLKLLPTVQSLIKTSSDPFARRHRGNFGNTFDFGGARFEWQG